MPLYQFRGLSGQQVDLFAVLNALTCLWLASDHSRALHSMPSSSTSRTAASTARSTCNRLALRTCTPRSGARQWQSPAGLQRPSSCRSRRTPDTRTAAAASHLLPPPLSASASGAAAAALCTQTTSEVGSRGFGFTAVCLTSCSGTWLVHRSKCWMLSSKHVCKHGADLQHVDEAGVVDAAVGVRELALRCLRVILRNRHLPRQHARRSCTEDKPCGCGAVRA